MFLVFKKQINGVYFLSINKTMSKRSETWIHFKRNPKQNDLAFCKYCSKQIGCRGSTTTELINHLKLPKININSPKATSTIEINNISQSDPSSSKKK